MHGLLTVKKASGGYRWVITCVTANDITVDFHWFQPDNANEQQSRMKGAKYFWLADLTKGFWQIRLHPESRWLFCFATPFGAKQYLRAPMGSKATAPFFDMCMAKILDAAGLLRKGVEMVHDDHAGFATEVYNDEPDGRSHFHLLRRYLKMCSEHRLRLSPKKFTLFSKEADIAGLLHRDGGLRPNPPRYQAMVDQSDPKTVGDVYNCMSAVGWSRSFIPNFAVVEQPVRRFVMQRLGTGRKTKRRADNIKLSDCAEWDDNMKAAFARLRLSVVHSIKRAYRDYTKVSCLFWDASKFAWSYTITQCAPEELAKPWDKQSHEILVTRSGLFKGAQMRWHIGCKEAYPAWRATRKDAHFLHGKFPWIAAGDHRNITYVQRRSKRPPNLGRASQDRLNHWCQDWAHENFQIYTIPGKMNLYNDFHSREGAPGAEPFFTLKQHEQRLEAKLQRLEKLAAGTEGEADAKSESDDVDSEVEVSGTAPVPADAASGAAQEGGRAGVKVRQHLVLPRWEPAVSDELDLFDRNLAGKSLLPHLDQFDWPGAREIAQAQQDIPDQLKAVLTEKDSAVPGVKLWVDRDGKIVLPQQAQQLIARICAAAHQGRHGHVPHDISTKVIRRFFWWPDLTVDVKEWMSRCLQCIKLHGGKLMPRPTGNMLTASQPMEVVAIDFLSMPLSKAKTGYKHILVIVDQLTRICVCVATKDMTAATAARIFCDRWLAFFPSPTFLISDGGTHFKCELFKQIAAIRGFEHHIVAPHSQWSNGRVERLNRIFLKGMRALLATRGHDIRNWPFWVPAVQECLNKVMRVSSRGNKTPMQLLTGLVPEGAIAHIAWLGIRAEIGDPVPSEEIERHMQGLHEGLEGLWRDAVTAQNKRRRGRKPKRATLPQFNVGDTVLVAKAVRHSKLDMTWTGPHEVVGAVNPFVYRVRPCVPDQGKRKPATVHVVRMRRFANAPLGAQADATAIERAALHDYPNNFVQQLLDHKMDGSTFKMKVRWLGFDRTHDSWEPLASLAEDVPDLVEEYLYSKRADRRCARALRRYFPG